MHINMIMNACALSAKGDVQFITMRCLFKYQFGNVNILCFYIAGSQVEVTVMYVWCVRRTIYYLLPAVPHNTSEPHGSFGMDSVSL